MSTPRLDPSNVPSELSPLLPWAERWGIGDDGAREEAVDEAPLEDLEALAHCLDSVPDDVLVGWLAGPESENPHPTLEYLAITCLTMAVHSARAYLKRRGAT